MAHDQEVLGSNPGTIYWIDVSDDASYYIKRKLKIKEAKWGAPKKKKSLIVFLFFFFLFFWSEKLIGFAFRVWAGSLLTLLVKYIFRAWTVLPGQKKSIPLRQKKTKKTKKT
jgi:hypothetical protein